MSVSVSMSYSDSGKNDWNCLDKSGGTYRRSGNEERNYGYCEPGAMKRIPSGNKKWGSQTVVEMATGLERGRRHGRTLENSGFKHLFSNFIVGFLFYGILLLAIWSCKF